MTVEFVAPTWSQVLTWVLVLAGWLVVHWATLNRERRKEKRDAAKQAIEELQQMEHKALQFHTSEQFDHLAAHEVRQKLERLFRRLHRHPLSELGIPDARLIELRQSVTLENFEPSQFKKQEPNSEVLRNVRNSVDDIIDEIELKRDEVWK